MFWAILKALEQGYKVRTSVRNLSKEKQLRGSLVLSSDKLTKDIVDSNLELFIADLVSDDGRSENFDNVDYVLHIASPFPAAQPEDPNDIVIPAVQGTLRILKAAGKVTSVKQVVITSSFASNAYLQSKTIAEQEAWKYVKDNNVSFDLTVFNPAYIFGPPLKNGTGFPTSLLMLQKLLNGTQKDGVPSLYMSIVDVRQLADLHLEALTNPKAKGERFITHAGPNLSLLEALPEDQTKNLPTKELEGAKDYRKPSDVSKVKATFNWTPYTIEKSFVDTVEAFEI
ncbi:putative short chain dehydrogenase [Scheffersomyces xylosifermentans]|uniref:putative short chain dehydrogenase n=1 Tax=Scheffersomyces xylosifermentans TaxID=1304137 RepID=UPI00315D0395